LQISSSIQVLHKTVSEIVTDEMIMKVLMPLPGSKEMFCNHGIAKFWEPYVSFPIYL